MFAKLGPLPTGRGWWFEPKWDGFRAIVRSGDEYTVRSRRGWLMTELLSEFASRPVRLSRGEQAAFGRVIDAWETEAETVRRLQERLT